MMNEAVGKRAQPSDTTGKSTNPQRTGMITAKSINGKVPQATPGFVITAHFTNLILQRCISINTIESTNQHLSIPFGKATDIIIFQTTVGRYIRSYFMITDINTVQSAKLTTYPDAMIRIFIKSGNTIVR